METDKQIEVTRLAPLANWRGVFAHAEVRGVTLELSPEECGDIVLVIDTGLQATRNLEARLAAAEKENERLTAELAKANSAHWFYYGDDCSSERCRFDIGECISEDFEWENKPQGNHVLQISGARPVPDMWVALHYFTEAEKDESDSDDEHIFTVHSTEEEARQALSEWEASK